MVLRAAAEGLKIQPTEPGFDELWELLIKDLAKEEGRIARSQTGKTYQLELSTRGSIQVRACELDDDNTVVAVHDKQQTASKESARLYWIHRNELGPDPENFTYAKTTDLFARKRGGGGGNQYTSLWIVYTQLLGLSKAVGTRRRELVDPPPVYSRPSTSRALRRPFRFPRSLRSMSSLSTRSIGET